MKYPNLDLASQKCSAHLMLRKVNESDTFQEISLIQGANDSNWWVFSMKYHYDLWRPLEAVLDFVSNSWAKMNFCCIYHCTYIKYFIHGAKCWSYQGSLLAKRKLSPRPPLLSNSKNSTFLQRLEKCPFWGQNRGQYWPQWPHLVEDIPIY